MDDTATPPTRLGEPLCANDAPQVLAEHDNSKLSNGTLSTITAAGKLGGPVAVLLVGTGAGGAAKAAAAVAGVTRVLVADHASLDHGMAETISALLAAEAKRQGVGRARQLGLWDATSGRLACSVCGLVCGWLTLCEHGFLLKWSGGEHSPITPHSASA